MAALLALFLLEIRLAGGFLPSSNTCYSTWASGKNFTVGDVLVFNFATGAHDVAIVTEDACENCNTANPINQTNTGPARITLTNDTDNYFICTTAPADRNWRLMSMQQPTLPHPHPHPAHHPALHPHHRLPVRPPLLLLHSSSPCRP
ncbi:umecyanin-like [Tripterygium wilfordii]|uniref:umecyanin-like n=1 Tax=Tripterygium wilfordii TaxID=458696 RepID=UPI0018F84C4F|nr:umecyanin-like [Tripterygium wilfordii]